MNNEERVDQLRKRVIMLNQVSPTFCLAKWVTSTTTLYNGMTHSCHHPVQHKIDADAVRINPSMLHNTKQKQTARAEMLQGIQTKECDYCWNIENLGADHWSDRHYKSANDSMGVWQSFNEVIADGVGANIAPRYLEIAFENICNFKCSYCSPDVSSRWMEEIQSHGPYKLEPHDHHNLNWLRETGRFPIHHSQPNPYIDAFWKWWPALYRGLHTFRITGGEPLLSKNTWRVLHEIESNPRPDLNFEINTNLGVPEAMVLKLAHKLRDLSNKIGQIVVYTSAESMYEQAEYSRFGMDWNLFKDNVEILLSESGPKVILSFMTTVNVLSVSTFDQFLHWITDLRNQFTLDLEHNRVRFNVSYLRWPLHQSLTILPQETKRAFAASLNQAVRDCSVKSHWVPMYLEEQDQVQRLIEFMFSQAPDPVQQRNFYTFFTEYDRRRGTNFLKTFPELQSLYQLGAPS
jgi:organic radical activating enzyme